ncbi:MATE efflux family protein [Natronobacterium gregoryi SP2]|uniref:MATE efflux family protein n=1 Tax=Natronobacterium gregoryi (strain ATCC 43098 / DSM 3393 / CCM 3738 / CIP 104747 / IAM 13177 / JCM 8860 / NBRC 102187 / NCIMB 2189 / SP2) TaxID=797304 RepID=L9Y1X4_NATGS|nr:MATE efflux family protein [Natronobacterium gregoryi SP2]
MKGVATGASGALKASGDTKWPFYSQLLGMFGLAIPFAYLGAAGLTLPSATVPVLEVTVPGVSIAPIGLLGLYLAFLAETLVPAVINYYRFWTGRWKEISRGYRPDAAPSDD